MKNNLIKSSFLILTCFAMMAFMPGSESSRKPIYFNTAYTFEERAADLVSRLTLEEKQSLLGNNMAAVPRLGIKSYNIWSEALHGVLTSANPSAGLEAPTSFPSSAALGSAWDPDLMKREAAAISDEARAIFATGTKGLTFWSPVVEPVRDPRWGRTGESYGEDPFLVSQIAAGFVQGMMGDDATYIKSVPTAKHFFANNSEFDRHVSSSNMDSRDMREFYLTPYKKLIEEDNLPSVMSSYNAVNHVPTSASTLYLDTIVRRTYGMKGYVTGDCAAIEDIYTGHYYVKTAEEATAMGLKAGVDSDCGSVYQASALEALKKGLITMGDIDRALANVFVIRMRTGEFDPAGKVPYSQTPLNIINSPANKTLAREVATRTAVLLKNNVITGTNRKALPINAAGIKKIALIGPQSDKVELGPYSGRPAQENMISPVAGIKKYVAEKGLSAQVVSSNGGNTSNKSNLFYIAGFELKKSDGTIAKYDATKYNSSSKGITVGSGMGSIDQVRTIDDGSWTAYDNVDLTNVDTIGIVVNIPVEGGIIEVRAGSPEGNLLTTLQANVAAGARSGGVYGAGSMMKVKVNKLGFNGPQTLFLVYKALPDAEIDKDAIAMAASSDVAVVFVGTDEKTATEEADRLTLLLPGNQVDLIKAVAAANPNTIVVMQTLGCVEVEEFKNLPNVAGIIWTGYNGQAQGDAIASILFGDVNPGGKLNATWYKSVKDLPEITDYNLRGGNGKNGRTFWYFNKDVSYEFGYGLSYTTFEYSNFSISKNSVTPQDKITVSVDVKNTGNVEGDEVVQVYMRTPDSPASLERPIKRLKGFSRVTIPAGQVKRVSIDINCADLWFWDMQKNKITFDQGKYVFEIGSSSKDIKGNVSATMNGAFVPTLKTVVADCDQVVLRPGNTVQTKVSAAMTDDSFYNVKNAKISYVSNNPGVASVDNNGLVTAKGVGVASIVAYVTIDGKTVEDSFALKVMPDLKPVAINVNGKSVPGFNGDVHSYSYLMKGNTVPQVTATAANPEINVTVDQAKEIPGTAVITLEDNVTVEKNVYLVNFGLNSVADEFNGSLGKQWEWVRPNASNQSLTKNNGSLVITASKGDITSASDNAENILLQDANTDWTADTKVAFSRKPFGSENGGMLAYQDDNNFVKLVYTATGGRRGAAGAGFLTLVAEEGGYQTNAASVNITDVLKDNNIIWLKLDKKGSVYTASYSIDGKNFKNVGSARLNLKDVKAGLIACKGVPFSMGFSMPGMPQPKEPDAPFEASYDYFRIVNRGTK
jgi:beta-glucosidase-like glycosyl hydrolase/regulation of enolase protein 1 (concanavalin A-like superfamily)